MRYAADVVHQTIHPADDDDRFCIVPIEASGQWDAARRVAEIAAARRYEEDGCVGFLTAASLDGWYRASIGEQMRSPDGIALRGVTILIHVWVVD